MAIARFTLPKRMESGNNQALIEATTMLEEHAKRARRPLRVGWRYDLWWLRGVRKFRVLWTAGEVGVNYQDDRGQLQIRYEDVLIKRQREIGRLMQIDVNPSVRSRGTGLDSLRKASIGQVTLENIAANINLEQIKEGVISDVVDFGTCGLGTWVQDSVHLGASPIFEVIPAWELLAIPTEPSRSIEAAGVCRDRWVSYDWVQSLGLKLPTKDVEETLEVRLIGPGQRLPGDADPTVTVSSGTAGGFVYSPPAQTAQQPAEKIYQKFVYLREYWIEGEHDRVARYIVKIGKWIAKDEEFGKDGEECPVMPIRVIRYYDTGFYGRSFVSPLIAINRQQEKMVANLFQNIIDLDLYGLKLIPTTAGIKRDALKAWGRLRYMFVEPDWNAPGKVEVKSLLPQNLGDMPAKIIEITHAMIDRLSRESDLWSGNAPGRIDNARSLGILYETSSIPMVPVTASIANAFAGCYKAMLQEAAKLLGDSKQLKLLTLDDAIAGVVLDPATGAMTLDENNTIPSPSDVIIDIRERSPRFPEKTKMELEDQFTTGKLDKVDYLVEIMRRNLDVPIGNRGIMENIRTAWLENILLFGDGKTPGNIIQNPDYDNHQVHLRILEDFMARPEWRLASNAVRTKFLIHKAFHRFSLGTWPDQLPNPEMLAAMSPELGGQLAAGAQDPNAMGAAGAPPMQAPM